ncbi:MAG: hypothetical protein WAT70_00710 [Rhizobiaceae bacterium]
MGGWSQSLIGKPDALDALIGGAATIVAAVLATFTGVLTYVLTQRRDRQKERDERRAEVERGDAARKERVDDMVRALHAEILSAMILTDDQLRPDEIRYAILDQTPFATPDETDFVFDSLIVDLSILPSDVIHSVVAYYRAAKQTNLMIREMRDPMFIGLTAPEKRKYAENFIAMVWVLRKRGETARDSLQAYASSAGIDLSTGVATVETGTRTALDEARTAIDAALAEAADGSNDGSNGATHRENLRSKRNISARKGK